MGKHKILIVDDDPNILAILRDSILTSDESYILYQALRSDVGIRIAKKEIPDLIITDWEMPVTNGIEFIKLLKGNNATAEIPVIMCTGVMTSSENLNTALQAGAVDYIRKPVDRIELTARIKSMLKLADSKKELQHKYLLIERKNSFISTLVESLPQPMVFYRGDGIIEGSNVLFQKIMAMAGVDVVVLKTSFYSCFSDVSLHQKKDMELLSQKKNSIYEAAINNTFYVFSKNIYSDPDTGNDMILCVLTDITPIKKAHEYVLEIKNREITSYAMRLLNLTETKNALTASLKKVLEVNDNEKGSQISQIINSLSADSQHIWDEFETHFSAVFEDFYINLEKMYPDLSSNDRKLCAFLRLNLSTKEIATLTFQNPKSVDMARYRLRKKMNLHSGDNISDILNSI